MLGPDFLFTLWQGRLLPPPPHARLPHSQSELLPPSVAVHAGPPTHPNGPVDRALDLSNHFATFGPRGAPWWVVFDLSKDTTVAQMTMKAHAAAQSPKTMEVTVANTPSSDWRLVDTLTTSAPWDQPTSFELSRRSQARYLKLTVTETHNGAAPAISYVQFYEAGRRVCRAVVPRMVRVGGPLEWPSCRSLPCKALRRWRGSAAMVPGA